MRDYTERDRTRGKTSNVSGVIPNFSVQIDLVVCRLLVGRPVTRLVICAFTNACTGGDLSNERRKLGLLFF
jgi:hypothetical protein